MSSAWRTTIRLSRHVKRNIERGLYHKVKRLFNRGMAAGRGIGRKAVPVAVLCLLVLFAQMALASLRLSLTYDEPIYTAVGYTALTTGDMHWHGVIGHPPLLNMLTAWPLLLESVRPDATVLPTWGTDDSLGFSRVLLTQFDSLDRVTLVTRLPVMWLTLLLAALVYRWARHVGGASAGLLALIAFAFNPNVVAHGQLNTTDMGVTAFAFVASYALARYLRRPGLRWYLGAGLGLGATLASKSSGLFLIGTFPLVMALFWLMEPGRTWRSVGKWALKLMGLMWIAGMVLWASYLFELQPLTQGGFPVPATSFWKGLLYQRSNVSVGQTTFLAGRLVSGGHWFYFPFTLLVKTPLPILIGLLVSLVLAVRGGVGPRWCSIPTVVTPLVYLLISMMVALNIGHRHLLPMLPFLSLFVGQVVGDKWVEARPWPRLIWGSLTLWLILGTLRVFPDYLAYFNELVGGPDNGYHYLADSSVDWGQGLKELKRYLDSEGIEAVRLAAFSSLDPSLYGLGFEPLPPTAGAPITLTAAFNPPPGLYAISVVPLQGLWLLDPDTYDWFRHRQPVAQVAHVYRIYDVPLRPGARWVSLCAAPTPLLTQDQIAAGFGRNDLRVVTFDCERSWVYPDGGSGWTVLAGNDEPDAWETNRLRDASLVFQQGQHWSHPALRIYAYPEDSESSVPPSTSVRAAPSDWSLEEAVAEGAALEGPISTLGPLTFLGYEVQETADHVALATYWRVVAVPDRPVSLMAHLLAGDGTLISVDDGLGVPIEMWQSGDVIVQRHALDVPRGTGQTPLWFEVGAYWLDKVERWPFVLDGQIVGDRLLLQSLL